MGLGNSSGLVGPRQGSSSVHGYATLPVMAAWPSLDLNPSGSFCGLWILLESYWCGQHSGTERIVNVMLFWGGWGLWMLAIRPKEGGWAAVLVAVLGQPPSLAWEIPQAQPHRRAQASSFLQARPETGTSAVLWPLGESFNVSKPYCLYL